MIIGDGGLADALGTTHRQMKDVVYEELRSSIVSSRLLAGDFIREAEVSRTLGVSKTPVREALLRLQRDRLVNLVPYKGAVVSGYRREDLVEVYELRELLEGFCARQAALNMSPDDLAQLTQVVRKSEEVWASGNTNLLTTLFYEFDEILYRQARNTRVGDLIGNLHSHLTRIGALTVSISGRFDVSTKQHSWIHEAIARRDPVAAEQRMREHVRSVMVDQLADAPEN